MREMRDSGVAWIGEIPEEWSLIRFKDKYKNSKEIAGEKSIEYQRLALTLNGVVQRPKNDSDGLQPKEFDTYQVLHENDFVFKMIDLQNISTSRVGLSPYTGLVSPAYIRFRPKNNTQYPRFIYYFLMGMYYNCVFNNFGGDGVRSALNASDIGTLLIPYPDGKIQKQIGESLDTICANVDTLTTNIKTQIEKLKAYKQSLITEVVTKGLDPISDLFTTTNSFKFIGDFIRKLGDHRAAKGNALTDEEQGLIAERINSVFNLKSHTLPIFDIKANAEEEDVSEIFVRVNSGGVSLKQNDFILTLLSLYWDEGRREIERFSKESTTPCKGKTTSYNPLTTVSAQDVIRVVMAYAFDRARLKYGYKLLRGADFDRKGAVDENLRTTRFDILKERLPDVLDVHSWHEFIKAIMNAGYLSGEMILSGNAIFYTYALYLIAKHRFHASYNEDMHLTSLWFFYASLVSLYTGSFESTVEKHLNTIKGLKTLSEYKEFILSRINERLTNDFFDITLVGSEGLAVSGRGNNAWNAYVASLNIMNAKILFSKSNLFVSKLFEPGTDGNRKSLEKHHLFPKAYLKSLNCTDAKINQMANYALIDWKDNMDILDDAPSVYYPIICAGMSDEQIRVMEEENALPHGWENMSYDDFLIERRKLMAAKIKIAFEVLKKAVTE